MSDSKKRQTDLKHRNCYLIPKNTNTDHMTPETQKLLIDCKKKTPEFLLDFKKIILGRCPTSYVRLQHPVKPAKASAGVGHIRKAASGL
ncbi:hypothetical protein CEXT_351691 [Caerostris extrusa]|uniref:Uncharacterized protein n=1 Tax=Caerostris extrusa TaxID=172846 RepID=A0AAV4V8Z3_CAEEX|nr:hypothetical protein CEXT_351691 [Caerostris extrusa]